jgi:hypothetical protein
MEWSSTCENSQYFSYETGTTINTCSCCPNFEISKMGVTEFKDTNANIYKLGKSPERKVNHHVVVPNKRCEGLTSPIGAGVDFADSDSCARAFAEKLDLDGESGGSCDTGLFFYDSNVHGG